MNYKHNKAIFLPLLFYILFITVFLMVPAYVLADKCGDDEVCLENPLGDTTSPQILIGKVINAVLGIVGSLALVMFIYGGFTWMLAAGNQEKVKRGKDILVWATVGLVVIFSAYALVKFVFTGLGVG